MPESRSTYAVYGALTANVDTGNEVPLLVGIRRSARLTTRDEAP